MEICFLHNFNICQEISKNSRAFIEAILAKIRSTIITHTSKPQKPRQINFLKISIQKVLSYEDWGQNLWDEKQMRFSKDETFKSHFDYFDYKDGFMFFILDQCLIPSIFFF